jgi:hypothetical protein
LRINWRRGAAVLALATALIGSTTACDFNPPPGGIHVSGSGDITGGSASAAPTSSPAAGNHNNGDNQQTDDHGNDQAVDSVRSDGTVPETVDNHAGGQLYGDSDGAEVSATTPDKLQYGKTVYVKCSVSNQPDHIGSSSVTALYLIAEGTLSDGSSAKGLWVVSDVMTNGKRVGDKSGVHYDQRVKPCT